MEEVDLRLSPEILKFIGVNDSVTPILTMMGKKEVKTLSTNNPMIINRELSIHGNLHNIERKEGE